MGRKKRQPKPPPETWRDRPWVWALGIGLAVFALYARSLWSGFVYDAAAQIQIGQYIHQPGNFWEVITFQVLGRDVLDANRPVQLFFLMVDSLLWGRNPFGYHLTTNLFHAANAAMLFLILLRLGANRFAAAIAALFFAAHPVLVEPVAEVSSREDVVAAFFVFLALLLAMRRSLWCVLPVVLACGAKETGLAAPFLIGLYWLLYRREEPAKPWAALTAACFLGAGIFLVARFGLQVKDSEIFRHPPEYIGGSFNEMLKIQPRIWALLFRNIAWPTALSADYGPWSVVGIVVEPSIVILVLLLAAQGWLAWKSRIGAMGMATFWLGLAPVSNFIPLYRPIADRFLYLPIAGLAMMVAALLMLAQPRVVLFRALAGVFLVATIVLAGLAWQRQAVFANSFALWTDTVAKSPGSPTANNNLAYELLERKDYPAALAGFQRTLRLNPEWPDALAGTAVTLEYLGRPAEAAVFLDRAIAREPLYKDTEALVRTMAATPENAAVLEKIHRRNP